MAEMPKGAKPAGILGSRKPPGIATGWKFASNTSIVPAWKLVAKRKAPAALNPMARPLYTAPDAELSTAIMAWVGSTLLFQPAIVPSSVANSSLLGPDWLPDEITKPGVSLVATPVGVPDTIPTGPGIVTMRGDPAGIAWPVPS